jgi:hypothetical protein
MTQQKLSLVDHPDLIHQLIGLELIRAANGNTDIRPPRSLKDDMAIAVAVAAFELSRVPQRSSGPILGEPKYTPVLWRSNMWYDEHVWMPCHKYPGCFEKGPC